MTISMHQALVPPFVQMLEALSGVLGKGASFAEARKIDPAVLLAARLAPDMFPLVRQVQVATDQAKGGAARLAGVEVPAWPDKEASFPELQARVARAVDYLKGFAAGEIDGSEARAVTVKAGGRELQFKGREYLFGYVYPNFFFHVTMAYAVLRHNGLEVGKRDFLGAVPLA
ncbi:MAG: DUF1993 family protein [Rhodospirillales bacterium]|nr:DUF1993 family protein [Rhodospirillales bacterium]